jgi:hypothetical protein
MISKNIILPVVGLTLIGGLTTLGISQAQAQAQATNPISNLVKFIAQKFNLDQNQVQAIVNQFRTTQQQNRQQIILDRQNTRLDQLVTQGKLTTAQKQLILTEDATLKAKYNPANLKNLTQAERQTQFQAEQAEIKTWAQSQGIDPSYVTPRLGMMGRGSIGMMRGRFDDDRQVNLTPTPTP